MQKIYVDHQQVLSILLDILISLLLIVCLNQTQSLYEPQRLVVFHDRCLSLHC